MYADERLHQVWKWTSILKRIHQIKRKILTANITLKTIVGLEILEHRSRYSTSGFPWQLNRQEIYVEVEILQTVFIFSQIINLHFKGTFCYLIFDGTEIAKLKKSLGKRKTRVLITKHV